MPEAAASAGGMGIFSIKMSYSAAMTDSAMQQSACYGEGTFIIKLCDKEINQGSSVER